MGNHDLYDTPEDIQREKEDRAFQETVRMIHGGHLSGLSGNYTVDELKTLMNMPSGKLDVKYTKSDLEWLEKLTKDLERRAASRIALRRHFGM